MSEQTTHAPKTFLDESVDPQKLASQTAIRVAALEAVGRINAGAIAGGKNCEQDLRALLRAALSPTSDLLA